MKRGKKYIEKSKLVDSEKLYTPEEAIKLAKECSFAKFDETVELHLRTGLDSRHADQQIRGLRQNVTILANASDLPSVLEIFKQPPKTGSIFKRHSEALGQIRLV